MITTDTYYRGQFSVILPVSYYYDGTAGGRLTVLADYGGHYFAAPLVTVYGPNGAALSPISTTDQSRTVELPSTGRYKVELKVPEVSVGVYTYSLLLALDEFRGPAHLGALDAPTNVGQMFT